MKSILAMLIFFLSLLARANTVTLVTMDIPAFMSPKLPERGAAIYALKKLFEKIDYHLEVRFIPIQRTRGMGMEDPLVNGFFPSFKDDDFVQGMIHSKPIYRTSWVIVERKNNPIIWKKPKDLLRYKGGNVGGYTLRSQVASVYKEKQNLLEVAPNDASNILMLARNHVDFIFIDKHVFEFIIATDPDIRPYANLLQVNPKIVALNEYGVAFKKDKINQQIMKEFNQVADEKEFTRLAEEYIKKYSPQK